MYSVCECGIRKMLPALDLEAVCTQCYQSSSTSLSLRTTSLSLRTTSSNTSESSSAVCFFVPFLPPSSSRLASSSLLPCSRILSFSSFCFLIPSTNAPKGVSSIATSLRKLSTPSRSLGPKVTCALWPSMYSALAESFCRSREIEEFNLAFLLPLPSLSALVVACLFPRDGTDEADFSHLFIATVGGIVSSGNEMCFAQQQKNSASSSCICWPSPSWYTRVRKYVFGARRAIEKSRGGKVDGFGGFESSGDVRTSRSAGARGMYVVVVRERRSSDLVRWQRSGKYTGVGIRRRAPRVICTKGYMRG